jgi:hypothetical protein
VRCLLGGYHIGFLLCAVIDVHHQPAYGCAHEPCCCPHCSMRGVPGCPLPQPAVLRVGPPLSPPVCVHIGHRATPAVRTPPSLSPPFQTLPRNARAECPAWCVAVGVSARRRVGVQCLSQSPSGRPATTTSPSPLHRRHSLSLHPCPIGVPTPPFAQLRNTMYCL